MLLSQIISSFTILFSYGVFENYQRLLIDDAYSAKRVGVYFNQEITTKEINGLFFELIKRFDGKIVDIDALVKDEAPEASQTRVVAFIGYEKGGFTLGDSLQNVIGGRIVRGNMFTAEDIEKQEKVAISNYLELKAYESVARISWLWEWMVMMRKCSDKACTYLTHPYMARRQK